MPSCGPADFAQALARAAERDDVGYGAIRSATGVDGRLNQQIPDLVSFDRRSADFFARILIDLPTNRTAFFIPALVLDHLGDIPALGGEIEKWQFKGQARNEGYSVLLWF